MKYSLYIAAGLALFMTTANAAYDPAYRGGVFVAAGDVSSAAARPACDDEEGVKRRTRPGKPNAGSAAGGGGGAGKVKFDRLSLKKFSAPAPQPKTSGRMVRADYCGDGTSQADTHVGGGGGGAGKVNF